MLSPMATQDRGWCVQEVRVRIVGRTMRQINFFMNGGFVKNIDISSIATGSIRKHTFKFRLGQDF